MCKYKYMNYLDIHKLLIKNYVKKNDGYNFLDKLIII